ncbi:synaptopodin-2-like [Salarias fasciatus]|uniref:synaptopodin-2-like n=1 Tax=Salarias fasciatus TaxID=181472 RepID=UPI00117664B7|nr:synaptopodin-2-like [Salarias fasciatus]
MEPEGEDLENDNLDPWSGSEGSQELGVSESLAESYNEEDGSEAEYPLEPQTARTPDSPDRFQPDGWQSDGEQPEFSGSEEEASYREEDDMYLSDSRESNRESPDIQTSQTPLSLQPERPDSEPRPGQISRPHSQSSSSALGSTTGMTLALTLTAEEPQGASNRQDPATENRRVESSEEGGSSEAPPVSVFFGISDEGAEQADKWNSESDTDLCRPDRHGVRYTRLTHNESQSERHVKETKSKCKRIARLLTDAPNPQNKGALLFKKRRQRVKKYTLVSYGTGDNKLDSEDHIEEETEEVRSAGYNFVATSDSELEEQYSLYHQQQNLSLNWRSVREMEALPDTKGKGVLMFAQRRKRIDEIVSEHEEMRSKGLPAQVFVGPECAEVPNIYDSKEMYAQGGQANYMDVNLKQHLDYQEEIQQLNHLSNVQKPLVPNRTAKPFLGFQKRSTAPVMATNDVPATRKYDARFKVPVPITTNPQVWSPTGDIIASRDERISVPAIKTGILPEPKRKHSNKQASMLAKESQLHLQNRGERKSFIESEEDCFSLGAEACNFMQPRTIKLKNPPPVAPKPVINPLCPPWIRRSPSCEPYIPPRSPISLPAQSPVGHNSSHYLQQDDWAQPQQMAGRWAPDQTPAALQTPANTWAPVNTASQLHLQPSTNSWSQQQPRSPVSMQACSPTQSPYYPPSPSRNKFDSTPNSIASFPPQAGKSYASSSKALPVSPVANRGINRGSDGSTLAGKGAALFAKRQSRMEKFVVDSDSVQVSKPRSPSPTSSLPNSWRYSSNIRAPPPLSYNPILAPFYPPSAAKQHTSTSPKIKPKTKEKSRSVPKHLNTLDIMKHQPYQLDSALFKYGAIPDAKSPSPKPTQVSKFEVIKNLKQKSSPSYSPYKASGPSVQSAADAHAKSAGSVSPPSFSGQSTRSAEPPVADKHLDEKLAETLAAHHLSNKQAPGSRPASTTSQSSSAADSIALAFSPASLIARGVRQMAPRPKFSAKKPVMTSKQRKSVAVLR